MYRLDWLQKIFVIVKLFEEISMPQNFWGVGPFLPDWSGVNKLSLPFHKINSCNCVFSFASIETRVTNSRCIISKVLITECTAWNMPPLSFIKHCGRGPKAKRLLGTSVFLGHTCPPYIFFSLLMECNLCMWGSQQGPLVLMAVGSCPSSAGDHKRAKQY